jgi:hypothetical protein
MNLRLLVGLFTLLTSALAVTTLGATETQAARYGYYRTRMDTHPTCAYITIDRMTTQNGADFAPWQLNYGYLNVYDYAYSYIAPFQNIDLRAVTLGTPIQLWCNYNSSAPKRADFTAQGLPSAPPYPYNTTLSGSFNISTTGNHHLTLVLTDFVSNQILSLGQEVIQERPSNLDSWNPCTGGKGSYPAYNTSQQALGIRTRPFSSGSIYQILDFGSWYKPDPSDTTYPSYQKSSAGWVTGLGNMGGYSNGGAAMASPGTVQWDWNPFPYALSPRSIPSPKDGIYWYDNTSYVDNLNISGGADGGKVNLAGKPYGVCFALQTDLRGYNPTHSGAKNGAGNYVAGQPVSFSGQVRNYSGDGTPNPSTYGITARPGTVGTVYAVDAANNVASGIAASGGMASFGPGGVQTITSTSFTPTVAGTYRIRACADWWDSAFNAIAAAGSRCVDSAAFTVDPAPGVTCGTATPSENPVTRTTGTITITLTGVSANAQSVRFPTWSNFNGQNDLVWYNGVKQGTTSTWVATVNIPTHADNGINTGFVNVHIYGGNGVAENMCSSTGFNIQPPPPDLTTDWLQLTNASGTAKTIFAVNENIYTRTRIWNYYATSGAPSGFSRTGFYARTTDATPAFTLLHGTFAANTSYAYCSWASTPSIADVNFNPCYGVDSRYADGSGGAAKSWKMATVGRYTMKMQINYLTGNDQSYEGPVGSANYNNNTASLNYDVTPLAPTSLTANQSECVDYTLVWAATPITNGSVQYRVTIKQGATTVRQVTQAGTSYSVSGIGNPLNESTAYTWTVESLWTSPSGTTFTSPAASGP